MNIVVVVLVVIVLFVVIRLFKANGGFDDPKDMSDEHLASAIGGQAEALERINALPLENRISPSIIELCNKRKVYMENLCLEAVSRGGNLSQAFFPIAQRAKEIESGNVSNGKAAVQAVKENFADKGVVFSSSWTI